MFRISIDISKQATRESNVDVSCLCLGLKKYNFVTKIGAHYELLCEISSLLNIAHCYFIGALFGLVKVGISLMRLSINRVRE